MMGDIKQTTLEAIMPNALRREFGDEVGNEVWSVMRIVDRKNDAIQSVLTALRIADTDIRRMMIVNAIWQRYYEKVAINAVSI